MRSWQTILTGKRENDPSMTHIRHMRKTVLVFLGLAALAIQTSGQQNNTLYFLKNVPAGHYLNPARAARCDFFLGLPGGSSVFTSFSNTLFNLEDLIFPGSGATRDSLITIFHPSYDMADFINKINTRGMVNMDLDESVLSMGFRANKTYVYLDWMVRGSVNASLPGDLLAFALEGNGNFLGETADFSQFGLNVNTYHEFGVGISREITPRLRIGFRPKVLLGIMNITTQKPLPDIGLYTDPNTFDLEFHSNLSVNVSAPLEITKNANGDIDEINFRDIPGSEVFGTVMNMKNLGLGLDLGAEYQLLENLTLSASLTDLGYIHWGANTYNFKQDGSFTFTGLDLSDGLIANADFDLEDQADALLDSIAGMFDVSDQANPYSTFLAPKLYLAGEYQLDEMLSFGILSRSEFLGKRVRQSLTFSANAFLARFLSLSLSYSMMNHRYDNLGAGLVIKGGPFHFYVITDRIPLRLTRVEATTSDFNDLDGFVFPNHFNAMNIRFGLNMVFGCKRKRYNDQPILMD